MLKASAINNIHNINSVHFALVMAQSIALPAYASIVVTGSHGKRFVISWMLSSGKVSLFLLNLVMRLLFVGSALHN